MAAIDYNAIPVSANTKITGMPLESLGVAYSKKRCGHVLMFNIKDFAAMAVNPINFMTPDFTIGAGHTFSLLIKPYDYADNRKRNNIGMFIVYKSPNPNDAIKLEASFRIFTKTRSASASFIPAWIRANSDMGIRETMMYEGYHTQPKLKILLHYRIIEIWKNPTAYVCDKPNCNKIVGIPNVLSCGHIYCQDAACKSVIDCQTCDKACVCESCTNTC